MIRQWDLRETRCYVKCLISFPPALLAAPSQTEPHFHQQFYCAMLSRAIPKQVRSRSKPWPLCLQVGQSFVSRLWPTHNKHPSPPKIDTELTSVQEAWEKKRFFSVSVFCSQDFCCFTGSCVHRQLVHVFTVSWFMCSPSAGSCVHRQLVLESCSVAEIQLFL